jgi:predicted peptidase
MERIDGPTLSCVVESPAPGEPPPYPVLCFLHGYDEGPPLSPEQGATRHGPLAPRSRAALGGRFLILCPQLPARGDLWHRHAGDVAALVEETRRARGGDPDRTYLTGFSYGGNGVLDLALALPRRWAALWPVDPTRVPSGDAGAPVWLSAGAAARPRREGFIGTLGLVDAGNAPVGERLWVDQGEDHVGSARRAYADGRIYAWLLSRRRA